MKRIICFFVFLLPLVTNGQTKTGFFKPDGSSFYRLLSTQDLALLDTAQYLITVSPNIDNYKIYCAFAKVLWEANRLKEAKEMFRKILTSNDGFYNQFYQNASDVPGDKTINLYGYGSYTAHYKHDANYYMSKIYVDEGKFDSALISINAAVMDYPVEYSCGTGLRMQSERYNKVYAACYFGLKLDDKVIDLLLVDCLDGYSNDILCKALKRKYSSEEIKASLEAGLLSILFVKDDKPTAAGKFTMVGGVTSALSSYEYYGGIATMELFGRKIVLPGLTPNDSQELTVQDYKNYFIKSRLYRRLTAN